MEVEEIMMMEQNLKENIKMEKDGMGMVMKQVVVLLIVDIHIFIKMEKKLYKLMNNIK